ncbi:MAG TPA: hypothetical protein VMT85_21340 [Thermoanaerobaculia bacterium]|nr:hypothetical protein [Thermoanaerobaculia bacterium]
MSAPRLTSLFVASLALAVPLGAAELSASFTDPAWEGEKVPEGEQCQRFGGSGKTPELKVTGIPDGANALVLEFSDASYAAMDDGGHGKVGYLLEPGATEITVPRAPGHETELQEPFFVVMEHKAPSWDEAGAYLPPCSGGRGNRYYLTVKAVKRTGDEIQELASTLLEMGTY